jgi:Spy/CpxP family protein refolding chaperone
VKQFRRIALGAVAATGLGLAVAAAYAHPGQMGGGMGPGMGGGMGHQMMGGMNHAGKGAMGPGAMSGSPAGGMGAAQLMTPEERQALAEKMRNAATPEERRALADATRAEMEKRAKDKGVTLPQPRGPHGGAEEHKH